MTHSTTKHKANHIPVHPQKCTILGERGNTFPAMEQAFEDALNADESPVEMQVWANMIWLNALDMLDPNQGGAGDVEDTGDAGDAGGMREAAADEGVEGGESNNEDHEVECTLASVPS